MALQTIGKRCSRIAALSVENPAKLWKALGALRSGRRTTLYRGRVSRQGA
jgi:hypothetical protein